MAEAKLAPKLPQWMIDHANCYISSGGSEAHIYTVTPPGYSEMHVPSLLLTTTGRKSGEKYVFPLFYGDDGNSYIIVASKGGAPDHPGWYKNLRSNPDVEVQVGRKAAGPSTGKLGASPKPAGLSPRHSTTKTCCCQITSIYEAASNRRILPSAFDLTH